MKILQWLRGRPARTLAAVSAAFLLVACTSIGDVLFGKVETDEQLAYRQSAGYVYLGIPLRNYVQHEAALPSTKVLLCSLDVTAFSAFRTARAAIETGGDELTVGLLTFNSALASLKWEIFQKAEIDVDPGAIASRAVVWLLIGTQSVAEMRLWRKEYVQAKVAALVAEGRAPSEEEWLQMEEQVNGVHQAIQDACAET